MLRLTALLLLALPATAGASPLALGRADHVARAGADAILTRSTSRTITVTAAPLSGGPARTLLTAPVPANRLVDVVTAASGDLVATLVRTEKNGVPEASQLYTGTPGGTLAPVPDSAGVFAVDVAGDDVILSTEDRTVALAPDGSRREVKLPGVVSQIHFAGDLVAFGQSESEEELEELAPKTLVVENWRTGERLRTVKLPGAHERPRPSRGRRGGGLAEDRRLAVLSPDGALRRLEARAGTVAWAGDRIVVAREQVDRGTSEIVSTRSSVVEPDGSQRRLGVEARAILDASGSADDLLADVSGCAMVTPIADGPATAYTGTGCTRSDAYITSSRRMPLRRTFSVPVRCLHAPEGQPCTGRVRGGRIEAKAYRIPAGTTETVRVRLTADAWRKVRDRQQVLVHLASPSDSYALLRRTS